MIHQLKAIIGFQEKADVSETEKPAKVTKIESEDSKKDADKEAFKIRISELDLSARVEASLDESGIRTVGGLARKREEDILAIEGLGQKGLQEIKRTLSNLGITLRG
jgi:DNA-directed RNA polymerase subunit alpha